MHRKIKTAALLTSLMALSGGATVASAAELEPLQGYAIALGDQAAAVHFRQHDGHKQLVTTLASANFQGERTRHIARLAPGGTAAVPLTPGGILVLEAIDPGATVGLAVRPDFVAGARVAKVADAD